jgi:flagellar assembly protein FliH
VTTSSSDAGSAARAADPREAQRVSAWQRWELASLAAQPAAVAPAAPDPQVLAAARAQAEREGREAGYAAGLAAASAERAELAALLTKLSAAAGDHEQRLVDEVLDLALVLARQLVGEALAVRREFILPIVSAALKQLPQSTQRVELLLNPADLTLVQKFVGTGELAGRCQWRADPSIAPGGCLIETEQCEIDVTIASRWRRLLAGLGRSDDWLEPV